MNQIILILMGLAAIVIILCTIRICFQKISIHEKVGLMFWHGYFAIVNSMACLAIVILSIIKGVHCLIIH